MTSHHRNRFEQQLLDAIWQSAGITQAELVKLTGHHHTFVRRIVNDLIKRGEVIKVTCVDDKRVAAYMQGN